MNTSSNSLAQPWRLKVADRNRPSWARFFPYYLFFFIYTAYAVYFLYNNVIPYLASMDLYAPRLLADSITYETICVTESNFLDWGTLRDIGPCIGLHTFNYNTTWLSLFNVVILLLSSIWLANAFDRPWKPILTLFIINPITFLSLFGPNKELFGIVSIIMMTIYVKSRSPGALLICLAAALFNRLPMLIIVAIYLLFFTIALPYRGIISNKSRRIYGLIIVFAVIIISSLAAIAGASVQYALLGDVSMAEEISQATSLSLSFDNLSGYGLYPVVYLVRIMLNFYSAVMGTANLGVGATGIYYNVGVVGSSILFALMTAIFLLQGNTRRFARSVLAWNIVLFIAIYTLLINLSPMIQHRYFYPLYVFLVLAVVPARGLLGSVENRLDDTGPDVRSGAVTSRAA